MFRCSFYIDGFNMYHALAESYPHLKWLDYYKLASEVIGPQDQLMEVLYFTAYAKWKPGPMRRHKAYIRALRAMGTTDVHGRFARRQRKCHLCGRAFWTHEEKRTDVNIALRMVTDAIEDKFDRAYLLSADSDLVPVVNAVHQIAPEKEVGVMFPISRTCHDLRQATDFRRKMTQHLLVRCQLPEEVPVGGAIIRKPPEWP